MRGCAVQLEEREWGNPSLYHIYFIHVVDGNRLNSSLFLCCFHVVAFFLRLLL